jgi:hypothetical protein
MAGAATVMAEQLLTTTRGRILLRQASRMRPRQLQGELTSIVANPGQIQGAGQLEEPTE